MSDDVECPYCEKYQEINHDDGYGYSEDETFEQECSDCGKSFVFTTFVSFNYNSEKAPCLNGGSHNYRPSSTWPKFYTRMCCSYCDEYRSLTEIEWFDLLEPMECISGY